MTHLQVFNAMKLFLENYYNKTSSDGIGALLSDLLFFEDGRTADPAAWWNWDKCIEKVLDKDEANNALTTTQALNAMKLFLEKYYDETLSDDTAVILKDISTIEADNNSERSQTWANCINEAKKLGEYREFLVLKKE